MIPIIVHSLAVLLHSKTQCIANSIIMFSFFLDEYNPLLLAITVTRFQKTSYNKTGRKESFFSMTIPSQPPLRILLFNKSQTQVPYAMNNIQFFIWFKSQVITSKFLE